LTKKRSYSDVVPIARDCVIIQIKRHVFFTGREEPGLDSVWEYDRAKCTTS
jgi:hypothetical protein